MLFVYVQISVRPTLLLLMLIFSNLRNQVLFRHVGLLANGFADGLAKQGVSRVTTLWPLIMQFFFFLFGWRA